MWSHHTLIKVSYVCCIVMPKVHDNGSIDACINANIEEKKANEGLYNEEIEDESNFRDFL